MDKVGAFFGIGGGAQKIRAQTLAKYSSWEIMAPAWSITDMSTYVREGHRKNALAYRCVEHIASAVAIAVLEAVSVNRAGEKPLSERDALRLLLESPSLDYPSQAIFFRQVVRRLLVTGESPMYKVPGEKTGRVVELQLLPPDRIAVERDSAGNKIYAYYFDPSREPKRLKPEEMIVPKFDDVLSPDRGLSPLTAAARETDVDNATADIRKTFFQNGAMLDGILTTDQQASPEQLQEWSTLWRQRFGGPKNAGKTAALAGGLSYQPVGASPDKWAFPDVTGLSEARICSAFGVPPILVGAKIGLDRATYSNYKEARSAFWEDTISPLLNFLAEVLTDGLTEPGDGRKLRWNTDEVPAFQEDADEREERAGRGLEKGAVTINEYREAAGLERIDDGDVYMMPSGVTLVPAGEIGAEPEPPPEEPPGDEEEPPEENGEEPTDEDPEKTQERTLPAVSNGRQEQSLAEAGGGTNGNYAGASGNPQELALAELPAYRRAFGLESLQRGLSRAIEGVLSKQADGIVEKLATTLDPKKLIDVGIEAQRMAEAVVGHIRSIFTASGEEAAKQVNDEGAFDADAEEAADFPDDAAQLLGEQMALATRSLIGDAITHVQTQDPEDWTNEDIAERLRETVASRDRADLVAATETVRSSNRAAKIAYRQNGVQRVTWRNTSDDSCEYCRALDDITVGVDEAFARLGDELEGEDGGIMTVSYEDILTPPTHPRCGCYLEHEGD